MVHQIHDLLQVLHGMDSVKAASKITSLESKLLRFARWLRVFSVALFLVLCFFALWIKFISPVQGGWIIFVQLIGIGSMLSALVGMILDVIPAFFLMINFRNEALRSFQIEIEHDFTHIAELVLHEAELLERVRKLLHQKIERINGRLGFFLGGTDKIALFALATMGWSAWTEFSALSGGWQQNFFIYGVAALGGLAFGGVMLNVVARRYAYQRDLLDLALDCQRKNEVPPRFHFVPKLTLAIRFAMLWRSMRRTVSRVATILRSNSLATCGTDRGTLTCGRG